MNSHEENSSDFFKSSIFDLYLKFGGAGFFVE